MRFSGDAVIGVPVPRAWELLHDPVVLAAAIPGCDQLEPTGSGTGRFTITPALAVVSGTYSGEFTVSGEARTGSVTVAAQGGGDRGTFTLDVTLRLSEAGGPVTLVRYDVGGMVSGGLEAAGQRLLASVISRFTHEFFAALETAAAEPLSPPPAEQPPRRYLPPARLRVAVPDEGGEGEADLTGLTGLTSRADVRIAFSVGVVLGLAGVIIATVFGRRRLAARSRR
jgi:carbon monoxide dehydrogenase subunit G